MRASRSNHTSWGVSAELFSPSKSQRRGKTRPLLLCFWAQRAESAALGENKHDRKMMEGGEKKKREHRNRVLQVFFKTLLSQIAVRKPLSGWSAYKTLLTFPLTPCVMKHSLLRYDGAPSTRSSRQRKAGRRGGRQLNTSWSVWASDWVTLAHSNHHADYTFRWPMWQQTGDLPGEVGPLYSRDYTPTLPLINLGSLKPESRKENTQIHTQAGNRMHTHTHTHTHTHQMTVTEVRVVIWRDYDWTETGCPVDVPHLHWRTANKWTRTVQVECIFLSLCLCLSLSLITASKGL